MKNKKYFGCSIGFDNKGNLYVILPDQCERTLGIQSGKGKKCHVLDDVELSDYQCEHEVELLEKLKEELFKVNTLETRPI